MEHYATLFDRNFLPQGMALHSSLRRCSSTDFTLWILCLDDESHELLTRLGFADTRLLRLSECETGELRVARANRSYGEYCWTLASHLFSFVFEHDPAVHRVTYVDADVYFLADPAKFIRELEASGKSVLITEHAYAPAWADYARTAGIYCVQFVTFSRDPAALQLLQQWQQQTRAQCSSDPSQGGFGDQVYLDDWPRKASHLVHVLDHRFRTLAPWNADHAASRGDAAPPTLFHFHGLRLLGARWVQWAAGYPVRAPATRTIYLQYEAALQAACAALNRLAPDYRPHQAPRTIANWLRLGWGVARQRTTLHRKQKYAANGCPAP
jgi:hypothetical protein